MSWTNTLKKKAILLSLIPTLVSGFGVLCNIIVINTNNGMPVIGNMGLTNRVYDILNLPYPEHRGWGEGTKLKFLADIFPINNNIYSIGDFLIIIGFLLWAILIVVIVAKYLKSLRPQQKAV